MNNDFSLEPAGSNLYYSLLFTKPQQKKAIIVLHHFYQELESILDKTSSIEMALQRFQWWRGELHRIFNGTPEHFAGKALAPLITEYNLPKDIFTALLNGIEAKMLRQGYENDEQLIEDAHHTFSLLAILVAHVLGNTSKEAYWFARELGVCWQITHNIKRLPWDLHKQRLYLPLHDLEQHHVTQENLRAFFAQNKKPDQRLEENIKQVLIVSINLAKQHYTNALQQATATTKKMQLPNIIYTQLDLATVGLIEKKRFSKKLFPLSISPLKKWWVSTRKLKVEILK